MSSNLAQIMWCKATLQYPTVNQLPLESVGDMLNKASNLATTANFQWSFIDKPADGSIFLVYVPNGTPVPPDGFMYMDSEQPYSMTVGGKLVEIWEHKYGFIPGQEQFTSRSRRRFRLGGKNPNDLTSCLWILFYSRTGEDVRVAANPMVARPQPIRKYPLPNITTKPFNLFQAMPSVAQMPNNQQQLQQQYQMQQMQQVQAQQAALAQQAQQAQLAQQNIGTPGRMPQLQQRPLASPAQGQQGYPSPYSANSAIPQKRTHGGHTPMTAAQHLPPEVLARMHRGETLADGVVQFEEPVGDVFDSLLPIDISRARFTRHHDWMEEIFSAYPTSRIKSDIKLSDDLSEASLTAQIAKYEAEMTAMTAEHEKAVEAIRNPQDQAGRIKAALETFATQGQDMDVVAIEKLEKQVNISPSPTSQAEVATVS